MTRRGLLAAYGFLLMTAYWHGTMGAATSPRWFVLAAALLVLPFAGRGTATAAHVIGLAFMALAQASLSWSAAPLDGLDAMLKLCILAGTFILGTRIADLGPFWTGAAWGLAVSSLLVVLDRLDLIELRATHPGHPVGLFVNGLFLAEAAAVVAAALISAGRWRLALLLAPALILVHLPRGPLLALAVGGLVLAQRGRKGAKRGENLVFGLIASMVVIAAALLAAWWRPDTVMARLILWGDALGSFTWNGWGYGSYRGAIAVLAPAATHVEIGPHNEFLGLLFELGVPGLFLGVAFCAILLCRSRPSVPLVVFLAEACFGFGLHLPATAGMFMLVAGHATRDLDPWRWLPARRGMALREGDGGPVGGGIHRAAFGGRRALSG